MTDHIERLRIALLTAERRNVSAVSIHREDLRAVLRDAAERKKQTDASAIEQMFKMYLADGSFHACAEVPIGSGQRVSISVGPERHS